ncbi:hypothetical protein [Streptococcus agalactiae]|nr:hypothetical protein [Streptococcus agalactiae]
MTQTHPIHVFSEIGKLPNCQIKLDILRNSEKPDMVFDNLKIS